ncbi:hypothetical protein SLS56_003304 [Neofusicoccum ribis]|uniref:Uncharacterized protein n=1 Tax=Neofusicoccum ribis TaxID=45134 RepID=A0ABR3SZR8_9PEZI
MSSETSRTNEARYCLVDRNGQLWPAVQCEEDMVPADEVEVRPSGYYQAVLLLAVFEFKWVLATDLHEFDPSTSQTITDGPQQEKLQAAFSSVIGSPNTPEHQTYPDLGFWRSELLARNLHKIENSAAGPGDTMVPPKSSGSLATIPPSTKNAKRPWAKFKLDNQFGPEFGHAKKIKTQAGKHTSHWVPDECDDERVNAPPPPGYFEKLKQSCDLGLEDQNLNLSSDSSDNASGSDDSDESDGSDAIDDVSSDEDGDEEKRKLPKSQLSGIKEEAASNTVKTPRRRIFPAKSTSGTTSAGAQSPNDIKQHDENQQEIMQLCRELDTARAELRWDQAETAANRLVGVAPWSDKATTLIAKVAFRVAPRPNVEGGFENQLRNFVAVQIAQNYEQLREINNTMVAMIFRDHEDLAEMVYERRLRVLRARKIPIVEIDSD